MHLYELDQHSAIADEGATSRRPATTISTDNGATWSTPSYLFSYATTIAPSVSPREGTGEDGRIELGVPYTVAPHQTNATFWRGLPGSWTAVTGPSTSTGLTSWVNVAQSDFGETLAVWPDNCDQEFGCDIKWAWSNNEGSSWTTGTLAASGNGTYSKPEIAYDPSNDRFVLLYIDVYDSFIRSMHAPRSLRRAGQPLSCLTGRS